MSHAIAPSLQPTREDSLSRGTHTAPWEFMMTDYNLRLIQMRQEACANGYIEANRAPIRLDGLHALLACVVVFLLVN